MLAAATQARSQGVAAANIRVARGPGVAMGAIAPAILKVAPKIFRLIKLLVCKPKKYLSANQRNCLRNLSYFNF